MERYSYYIGFGANLGSPTETFRKACLLLSEKVGTIDKVSSLYKTRPLTPKGVSSESIPDYYNSIIKIYASTEPFTVMETLLDIEEELGRSREQKTHWKSRQIDLDIISIDGVILDSQHCCVPHPEMHKRDFVLVPLREINPDFVHPLMQRDISSLIKDIAEEDLSIIEKIA